MNKPEGPTPPEGYRWVEKGRIVWPSDVTLSTGFDTENRVPASVFGLQWEPCEHEYNFIRSKVTQPDLAWLKSKALEQAKSHPEGSVEREQILWAVTEAVRAYSDALRSLVPEREQWRPGPDIGVNHLPARRISIDDEEGGEA